MVTETPVKKTEQPESLGAVSAIEQTPSSSMNQTIFEFLQMKLSFLF